MTILQANKFFYEKGGSERYFFALSRALESCGHRVVPFAMDHPRNVPSPYSRHFVPRREYDEFGVTRGSLRAALNFVRSPDAARRMSGLLAQERPDVAHLHNIYHQLTPSIIDALADHGVPMVMTLHDYKLVCPSYGLFAHGTTCYRCRGGRFHQAVAVACAGSRVRSALLAFESYWQRWTHVYDRVACFIAPSEYLRRVMIESGVSPERIEFIAPLNPASISDAATPSDDLGRLEAWPARFIAYVGRLSPEKGVRILLEAMGLVPDVPLVVFGEGPESALLRSMVTGKDAERIFFAGHASRGLIERSLERATAVVLPTLSPENAPMAILEAASAGVPVIVSDRGGLPGMAASAGGRVVPAGDVAALAEAIRDAWQEEPVWRERARRAWEVAGPAHDGAVHVARITAIYERAMARGRKVA